MVKNSLWFILLLIFNGAYSQENHLKLMVGTYTNECESDGIYVYDFDLIRSSASLYNQTEGVVNPSFISISDDAKIVYAVNENGVESSVSAYKYEPISSSLTLINKQKGAGDDPCHLINDENNVLVANYSSGSISVFKKSKTGGLNVASQTIKHVGRSKNPDRQASPHVHQVQFSPDHKYVLATDLGTDKIYIYNYNATADKEILTIKDSVSVRSGGGPRHLTFSPNGKFAYLLQELDGGLIVYKYHDGFLQKLEETQVVNDDFKGEISAADIHFSPDGNFLYATNRGDANDITVFIVQKDGRLNYKASYSSGGNGPRNFVIDPTGAYLLVANQYSDVITIFKRDMVSGRLTLLSEKIEVCSPVCLVFVP